MERENVLNEIYLGVEWLISAFFCSYYSGARAQYKICLRTYPAVAAGLCHVSCDDEHERRENTNRIMQLKRNKKSINLLAKSCLKFATREN